jgi:protein required for attachment to host cells
MKGYLMQLPKGTLVAVADGKKLSLFRNGGTGAAAELTALPEVSVDDHNRGSGSRHQSSAANPSDSQQQEDGFAAGVADYLNKQVMNENVEHVVVIAAPRTLGELRKHYHTTLTAALVGEISKELTGHTIADIEKALSAA